MGKVMSGVELYHVGHTLLSSLGVYADSSQSNGLGLSDLAGYRTPALPGAHGITRIYAAPAAGRNGSEVATTGIVDRSFGLVVGWRQ